MRKIYLSLFAIIIVLIVANIFYYRNIYKQQVNFQKNILMRQTEICSWEVEQHISGFINELNFILFTENLPLFFTNHEIKASSTGKIETFFQKYKELITTLSLYDNQKNIFNIFKDRNNNAVTDLYVSREQQGLFEKESIEEQNGESVFILPYFLDSKVTGNIVVKIDTRKYIQTVFENYHIKNTLFQWLINSNGDIVFSTFPSDIADVKGFEDILQDNPGGGSGGSLIHRLVAGEKDLRVISTYYPIKVMQQDMLVVFSLDTSIVVSYIINSVITISVATFLALLLIIAFFLFFIRKERKQRKESKNSEHQIRQIFEMLPVGIILKDHDNKIKLINNTALKILKIDTPQSVLGKDLSNMFFLCRDYQDNFIAGQKESTSEYIYYDADEEEVVLYKKELPVNINGEKFIAEAFIDISPLEDSRKSEFLWGEAKSEFLKQVSHDIRNPLNAILNLTDSMKLETPPLTPEAENLEIIRNCCEDIVLVVNDIIDFSSFEAGNILIEEIPFSLTDEVSVVINSFLKKAESNNTDIKFTIDANVPEKIIGDPFRIRQVLTKLLRNSIKYTSEGEISLFIKTKKQQSDALLLEFVLEDTGIGMPEELINKFNKKEDLHGFLSRGSYGLNRIRQLINLMKGDINIGSALTRNPGAGGPGTKVTFCLQVLSNEVNGKNLNFDHISGLKDLRTLVLSDSGKKKSKLQSKLKSLKISCETIIFNYSTIELIKSRLFGPPPGYSIIFIIDSDDSNGFSIARQLHKNELDQKFLIIFISSANMAGNFIKSKRFGADYYLAEPFETSEISGIIQKHFSNITFPESIKTSWKQAAGNLKILVAEDNPANQVVAKSLFKRLGYEIDIAVNGKDAVSKARENVYDIIFMDVKMPEKNGLDATYEIRNLGCTMPIVAMTAQAGESDRTGAIEAGMNEFITKPVSLDILKNIIIKRFSNKS